jgi:hypothetical protein
VAITTPLQQNWYWPVCAFNRQTLPAFVSSYKHAVHTVTANPQLVVLPTASVAVQVTLVVPTAKTDPEGGTQATVAPGQLSLTAASVRSHVAGDRASVKRQRSVIE